MNDSSSLKGRLLPRATLFAAATIGSIFAAPAAAIAQQVPSYAVNYLQDQALPTGGDDAAGSAASTLPPPGPQADPAPGMSSEREPATTEELADILRRLDALEQSLAKPGEENKPAEKPAAEKSAADAIAADEWDDLSAEKWTVKLGGHVQLDFIHWADADDPPVPAQDYFEFRRLRLLADGTGYGVYDFRLQIDIEPESGDGVATPVVDVKDAYFHAHEWPCVDQARIGNFFVPFSLEQVTNDTNNIFMERSIPTQGIFAADREVGVAFYGVNDAKNFTWTFGTFIDSISESLKERIDDNQGQRFSGRLTWLPYYDEPSNGRYLSTQAWAFCTRTIRTVSYASAHGRRFTKGRS